MPFTNSIPFEGDRVENQDFFLWRGIAGVPSERPVALGDATYDTFHNGERSVPAFLSPSGSGATLAFGITGTYGLSSQDVSSAGFSLTTSQINAVLDPD